MKVINLIGASCSGKSTTAAGLFYKLKLEHVNCELVTEYAKDLTWEDRKKTLANSIYVLGKQYQRLDRLRDKVEYVITDSPLLLNIVYNTRYNNLNNLVLELYNSFDNDNFFLPVKSNFSRIGRNETYEEAIEVERKILQMLKEYNIGYKILVD